MHQIKYTACSNSRPNTQSLIARWGWVALLTLSLMSACGGNDSNNFEPTSECISNFECSAEAPAQICLDSACVPCTTDASCQAGHYGSDSVCVEGQCQQAPEPVRCDHIEACDEGQGCSEGVCVVCENSIEGCPCDEDDTCDDGLVCDTSGEEPVCREPLTCFNVSCLPNQLCGGDGLGDAMCVTECMPGFIWSAPQEACVQMTATKPTCDASGDGSIAAECVALERGCVEDADGAHCGDCRSGYTDEGNSARACRPLLTCPDLDCVRLSRDCTEATASADATCGECLEEHHEEGGRCVATQTTDPRITCEDRFTNSELACAVGESCVDDDAGGDSVCRPDEPDQPGQCEEGEAFDRTMDVCIGCSGRCSGEGLTGQYAEYTSNAGECICETEPGYFFRPSAESVAKSCDQDGDGWINLVAYNAFASDDEVIRENARCSVRHIDRFILENEWRQRKPIYICEGDEPLSETCADSDRVWAPLVEANAHDDAFGLENQAAAFDLSDYTYQSQGRKLQVEELNPLTKTCVGLNTDYNLNGLQDRSEHHDEVSLRNTDAVLTLFSKMTFFIELHQHQFESGNSSDCGEPESNSCGQYVISEFSRCDGNFPLTYEEGAGDYWRECTRGRDAAYTTNPRAQERMGYDFGEFSGCQDEGLCPVPAPPMSLNSVERVQPHGLCNQTEPLPESAPWRGMTHHSQFKCASILQGLPDPGNRRDVHHGLYKDEIFGGSELNHDAQYLMNRCWLDSSDGANPRFRCDAIDTFEEFDTIEPGQVGFVVVRYGQQTICSDDVDCGAGERCDGDGVCRGYLRGCIDEWHPQNSLEVRESWRSLCPGFLENPESVQGLANTANFGEILCGCSPNFGGATCQQGCANPMYGGLDNRDTLCAEGEACGYDYCADDFSGFCPVEPDEDGGRRGAWLCGGITLSPTLSPNGPGFRSGSFSLTGEVSMTTFDSEQEPMMQYNGVTLQGSISLTSSP